MVGGHHRGHPRVAELLRRAARPARSIPIAAATTASTVAVLDAAGEPLRPAILWMDTAAAARSPSAPRSCHRSTRSLEWSGGSDAAEWLVPKAMWLRAHDPDNYHCAARIVEAVDYVTFRLTGQWVGSR